MDLGRIGKFIQECRKKNNLTQAQLAEKLNITDRAISKWENGRAMPDSSIMLPLCKELKISVTDLLSGERIAMENQSENLEKQLVEMAKEKERADKHLLTLEIVFGVISVIILLALCIFASYAEMADWLRTVLILIGFAPILVFSPFAIMIEQRAGYYECKKCNHKYVPTFKSVFFAMHSGRTRYMKCPKCGQKSWQKKVISKD